MTKPVNDPLGNLITLMSEVLADVRQGRIMSLERMGQEFEELYQQMQGSDGELVDQSGHKTRLKTLNRLRAHLAEEVQNMRGTTLSQLGVVTRGKRGLKAYQAAISDPERGVKRGEG